MRKLILIVSGALALFLGAAACGGTSTSTGMTVTGTCTKGPVDGVDNDHCDQTWLCAEGAVTYRLNCTKVDGGTNYECDCFEGGVPKLHSGLNPFQCDTGTAVNNANMLCGWMIEY